MIVGSQKKILIFKTEEKSKSEIQGVVYFYSDDADQVDRAQAIIIRRKTLSNRLKC